MAFPICEEQGVSHRTADTNRKHTAKLQVSSRSSGRIALTNVDLGARNIKCTAIQCRALRQASDRVLRQSVRSAVRSRSCGGKTPVIDNASTRRGLRLELTNGKLCAYESSSDVNTEHVQKVLKGDILYRGLMSSYARVLKSKT